MNEHETIQRRLDAIDGTLQRIELDMGKELTLVLDEQKNLAGGQAQLMSVLADAKLEAGRWREQEYEGLAQCVYRVEDMQKDLKQRLAKLGERRERIIESQAQLLSALAKLTELVQEGKQEKPHLPGQGPRVWDGQKFVHPVGCLCIECEPGQVVV